MKKRSVFIKAVCLALCAALPALLAACTASPQKQTDGASDERATYEARIAELEAQLAKYKEERFISDTAYKARIEELESKLQSTSPDVEGDGGDVATFTYRVEDGKAILTGYEGRSDLVTVPTELDGYPVVAIGERAFEGTGVVAVTLPHGVEEIGWFAFYGCTGLMDVTIPASVTTIGYAVFDGCERVTVIGRADSYAAAYAKSYGLPFVAI